MVTSHISKVKCVYMPLFFVRHPLPNWCIVGMIGLSYMYFQLQPKFWPWQWVWLINQQCIASLQSGGCALPAVTSHDLKVKIYFQLLQHGYIFTLSQSVILENKSTLIHICATSHFLYYMEQQHIALSVIDDNSVWSRNGSYVQTGMHQRNAPIHINIYTMQAKNWEGNLPNVYICNTVIYKYHITQPHGKCTLSWFSVTSNLCVI